MSTAPDIAAAPALAAPRSRQPPGPRGLPLIGVTPALLRDPLGYLPQVAKRYGDVARVPLIGTTLILVSHPDHVNHVMNRHADRYEIAPALRMAVTDEPRFPAFFGALEGDPWKRVRRVLNPRFSQKGMVELSDLIAAGVSDALDDWDTFATTGRQVDIQEELHLLSLAVLLRSMFSTPTTRQEVEHLVEEFHLDGRGMAWKAIMGDLPGWLPRPHARSSRAALNRIGDHLDHMVARRRAHPVDGADLLNTMLDARFDDGSALSDMELRAELRGMIFAGHETTATALAWTLAFLGDEAAALDRAHEEVEQLGGRRVAASDLPRLPWLKACFEEAQRLQGFALVNARHALEEDEIAGYRIPQGSTVGFSAQGLFRDPRFWRAPESFRPSRFIDEDINRHAFPLFGVGPHRCVGMRMAYMVGVYTLATVLQRYRITPAPGFAPKRAVNFGAARLADGLPARVERI